MNKQFIVKIKTSEPRNIKRLDVYLVNAKTPADAIRVAAMELTRDQKNYVTDYHAHKINLMDNRLYIYGHDNFGLHDPIGVN